MEAGGQSQFLAKAITMLEIVEKKMNKLIINFVWAGNNHLRINQETLFRPVTEGGLNLLDIKSRNEALDLMCLKDYLNMSDRRSKWAILADRLLANAIAALSRNVDPGVRQNAFQQSWNVSTWKATGLPEDLQRMVKAANKYGVALDVRNPTEGLKNEMLMWYHMGLQPGWHNTNSSVTKCLWERHSVMNVAAAMTVARQLCNEDHKSRPSCPCYKCNKNRTVHHCDNPHRCVEAARKWLAKLVPLWMPGQQLPGDGLTLTRHQMQENTVQETENGWVTFDPSIHDDLPMANAFCVFTTAEHRLKAPARRP